MRFNFSHHSLTQLLGVSSLFFSAVILYWGAGNKMPTELENSNAPLFSKTGLTSHDVQYLQAVRPAKVSTADWNIETNTAPAYFVYTNFWNHGPGQTGEPGAPNTQDPVIVSAIVEGGDPVAVCSVVAPPGAPGGSSNGETDCNPEPPVVSVLSSGPGGGAECSVASEAPPNPTAPPCSAAGQPDTGESVNFSIVGPIVPGSFECSIRGAENDPPEHTDYANCSIKTDYGASNCSVTNANGHANDGFCSAYVGDNPNASGNRMCSIVGNESGTAETCSVTPDTNVAICSTSGGEDSAAGNPSCSVGSTVMGQVPDATSCSVRNIAREAVCSTFKGTHQNCSAGQIINQDETNVECSVSSDSSHFQFCSVTSAPTGAVNNKCSTSHGVSGTGSTIKCSVTNIAGNANQFCSIMEGSHTGNSRCTVLNMGGGTENRCSAFTAAGSDTPSTSHCSVIGIGPPPGPVQGPGTDGQCGSGTPHLIEWPPGSGNWIPNPNLVP